jgi:hypothetical protein
VAPVAGSRGRFLAPAGGGLALYDLGGRAMMGDRSRLVTLYDAGVATRDPIAAAISRDAPAAPIRFEIRRLPAEPSHATAAGR